MKTVGWKALWGEDNDAVDHVLQHYTPPFPAWYRCIFCGFNSHLKAEFVQHLNQHGKVI